MDASAPAVGHSASWPLSKTNAFLAISVGGLIAGTLDLTQACILFGWKIPFVIAAGLLDRQAIYGDVGTYVLAWRCISLSPAQRPGSTTSPAGPYTLKDLILGLLVHMVVVGLPISYSVRRFAKEPRSLNRSFAA